MINEEIIDKARAFVKEECGKESSKYGHEPYGSHFVHMHNRAKELAEKFGADVEVVRLAAWLHDIGSIIYGRENHHITGAKIAGEKLKEWGYPEEKIGKVKKCILNHRGSVINEKESVEEQIISDADAICNFDNIAGIFNAAFIEGNNQLLATKYVKKKLGNCYKKLSSGSKEIVKDKYDAAMLLFGGEEK